MSKQQDPVFEVRDIDPQWAGEILDRHYKRIADGKFAQRPITKAVVTRLAADMTDGNFLLTHQGIAFDTNDNLIDGQHRLEAVRKSGKTVKITVSTGWTPGSKPGENNGKTSIIDVVDNVKPRSIDQMMHMHGQEYAKNYTTTIRSIARVAHVGITPILTYSTVNWMLDELDLRKAITKIMSVSPHVRDFQGKLVGPLAYYYTAAPRKAMEFAEGLFNYQAAKGSPVSLFLNWSKVHARAQSDIKLKALAACLRAADKDEDISYVKTNVEALEWLALSNPKLREQIRARVPRSR